MKKTILFLFCIIFFATISQIARAETKTEYLMDEGRISMGKTIESQDAQFFLGIRPNVLEEESLISIEEYDYANTPLPDGLEVLSKAYLYNIRMTEPKLFSKEKPIIIRMKYNSDSNYKKNIYYWDSRLQKWQKTPAKLYRDEKYLSVFVPFPYAPMIVLQDPSKLEVPQKSTNASEPSLNAHAAIAMDAATGEILYNKNADELWWPASITKLMSSLVFLDTEPDWNQINTYTSNHDAIGAKLRINNGETLSTKDVFYTTLIGSANNTANFLPTIGNKNHTDFVNAMNQKAKKLGMVNTTFSDVSGLSSNNRTTAHDVAILANEAGKFWDIFQASSSYRYNFYTKNTNEYHSIKNTNKLLGARDYDFLVGKTGYIDESMYNFTAKLRKNHHEIVVVILGASTSTHQFNDTNTLAQYIYGNYTWDE